MKTSKRPSWALERVLGEFPRLGWASRMLLMLPPGVSIDSRL